MSAFILSNWGISLKNTWQLWKGMYSFLSFKLFWPESDALKDIYRRENTWNDVSLINLYHV